MESKQYPTSLRLSETEKEYLTKIAYDNALLKSNNEPSLGLAIKHLIREKILEKKEEKQGENVVISDDINHLVKLTEQINIMIPHLVHAAQISTKCLLGKINDTEIAKKIFTISLDETVKKCGQIQDEEYKNIYVSNDKNNMKTIPIEEGKNQWK
ncbi:hypothetical protein [Cysteiniphilum sp. 6C5]|uniref:hypothetical protein n=1 Tax=unclassified Cysteiniphilum TaxID=2610889 RepID=UPI003F837D01